MEQALHIAISTGQNIANLIPILELGKSRDRVLFINSETARDKGWTDKVAVVLKQHDFVIEPYLDIGDNDQLLVFPLLKRLLSIIEHYPQEQAIVVHLTGGQKMTAISLFQVFSERPVKFVYMDNQPVQLIIIDNATGNTERRRIQSSISLIDVLAIYGSKLFTDKQTAAKIQERDFPVFAKNQYLISGLLKSFDVSEEFDSEQNNQLENRFKGYQKLIFERIQTETERLYENAENNQVLRYIPAVKRKERKREIVAGLKNIVMSGRRITKGTIFNPPKNTFEIKVSNDEKKMLIKYQFLAADTQDNKIYSNQRRRKMGDFFEEQVFDRLMCFLSEKPQYKTIISEIWQGLKIVSEIDPDKITGEYDIYILLKNGLGISMECKSFLFEEKDLFARIARLTRRTSHLSQQWIVFPFFTEEGLYHPRMLQHYLELSKIGLTFIPFGRAGQPEIFEDPKTGKKVNIYGFEKTMHKLLQSYLTD